MLNTFKNTKLSIDEITSQAKEFFGENGLKLDLTEEKAGCLNYTSGSGYVNINITKDNDMNRVDIITVDMEDQAEKFLSGLK